MTDKINESEESKEETQDIQDTQDTQEVTKIKVGDKEYSQDDLDRLVGLGEKASEIEKHHGNLDKFVTESGRRADEIGKYKKKLEEIEKQFKEDIERVKKVDTGELTQEQYDLAKKQLHSLLGGEPITQGNFARMYVAMREGEKLIDECDKLSDEINGEDGRPKFERDDIIQYMSETGIKKPMLAYKDKFENELKDWETAQLSEKKKEGIKTLKSSGEKQPTKVSVSKDNLGAMISEALYGPQE